MIQKLIFALGAVVAFEGLILAIAPSRTIEAIKKVAELDARYRSYFGLIGLAVGTTLLWLSGV